MMDQHSSTVAMNSKNDWFEYAYYSSPVTFERDGEDGTSHVKPLKLQ